MNDAARSQKTPQLDVTATATKDEYDRNFWLRESPKFAKPHFRLEKAARVITRWRVTGSAPSSTSGVARRL